MNVPSWWPATLLALAAFRTTRLVGWDDLTEPWRQWVRRRFGKGAETFVSCAWCVGAYVSLGIYLLWVWFPTETLTVCVPLAISAAVGLIAKNLDP